MKIIPPSLSLEAATIPAWPKGKEYGVTKNGTAMRFRVRDLRKGDRFRYLGYDYRVHRVDETTIYYITCRVDYGSGTPLTFGRKSQQIIELIDRSPEVSKLTGIADEK